MFKIINQINIEKQGLLTKLKRNLTIYKNIKKFSA